jgi:hypothetical protein
MITPVEAFRLGWQRAMVGFVGYQGGSPTDAEIAALLARHEADKPTHKGPPYEVHEMKEWSIG